MQLLPDDVAKRLPPLYSQEEQGDNAIAVVKFFTPWIGWTWYASEYHPAKRLFFGVVVGQECEFGYFSLDELEEIRGQGDNAIAVVKFFTPWTGWPRHTSEYNPQKRLFLSVGQEREYGNFSRDEIEAIRGPGGITIERDLYWKPKALKECR